MIMGEWITNNVGRKTRTVNLTVALTQAVGPKCSQVLINYSMAPSFINYI